MAGEGWQDPQGFDLPAAFEKRKKPGRREYLRARVRDGRVEVFPPKDRAGSAGSAGPKGWSRLKTARAISNRAIYGPKFIPYGSFGL